MAKNVEPPYSDKITKVLPILFNMVELESKRGKRLGMEVGTARERVLIALFMYVYGPDTVEFPPSASAELDVIVSGKAISIKTKSTGGFGGVKLIWTVDWNKVDSFVKSFSPQSDMLFVQILWGKLGGFFLIPKNVQHKALQNFGNSGYMKLPKRGTNPRGVELSAEAMEYLQTHKDTLVIDISWQRDSSLLVERALYHKWINLWDVL